MTNEIIAWSSAAVALFAILQVALVWLDRRDRIRAAYHVVHGKWTRLLLIGGRWQDEDLIRLADRDALDPSELLPPDTAYYGSGLSLLGHGAAILGSAAFNLITGAVRNCQLIRAIAAQSPPEGRTARQLEILRGVEKRTKDTIADAMLLLEDALQLIPPWLRNERFDLGDPKSEMGKTLTAEMRKLPRSRLSRIRGAVAAPLYAIARRIDGLPKAK